MHCPQKCISLSRVKAEEHNDVSIKSDSHWSYLVLLRLFWPSCLQLPHTDLPQEQCCDPEPQQFDATLQKQA